MGLLTNTINNIFSVAIPIVALIILVVYWIPIAIRAFRERGFSQGITFSLFRLLVLTTIFLVFGLFPELLASRAAEQEFTAFMAVDVIRWFMIYVVICPLVFILTYRLSKFYSTVVTFCHITILLIGWTLGKWLGIIFTSIPVIVIFYLLLYRFSQIIFPVLEVEEGEEREREKRNKTRALFWYVWGVQYPFWVAKDSASRVIEQRISGNNFNFFGEPGIVWTHSHQVTGLSSGVQFSKVDGPGICFSRRFESPIALIDLRRQIRTVKELQAVTQDGVPMNVVLFTSFAIDDTNWKDWNREDIHHLWRKVPILQRGTEPDKNLDSRFPYSSARVHAAISTTSRNKSSTIEKDSQKVYWDDIVVQRVEREARIVLSERTLDELWIPRNDFRGASALDEIETTIKERAIPRLQEMGVRLFTSRVVGFNISQEDPIREQLISSWLGMWEQKTQSAILDGETEANMSRIRAQTSTSNTFLQSITDILRRARQIDPNLPKQVVALNFISALGRLLDNFNTEEISNQMERLAMWREIFRRNR